MSSASCLTLNARCRCRLINCRQGKPKIVFNYKQMNIVPGVCCCDSSLWPAIDWTPVHNIHCRVLLYVLMSIECDIRCVYLLSMYILRRYDSCNACVAIHGQFIHQFRFGHRQCATPISSIRIIAISILHCNCMELYSWITVCSVYLILCMVVRQYDCTWHFCEGHSAMQ